MLLLFEDQTKTSSSLTTIFFLSLSLFFLFFSSFAHHVVACLFIHLCFGYVQGIVCLLRQPTPTPSRVDKLFRLDSLNSTRCFDSIHSSRLVASIRRFYYYHSCRAQNVSVATCTAPKLSATPLLNHEEQTALG